MPNVNWKRLGELLVRRRIELDPRYSNRQLFAAERGINYRIVSDLERGRRDNYEETTLTAAEVAYKLASGSLARALETGELEPLPVYAPAEPPVHPVPRNPFSDIAADEPEDDPAWDLFPDPADRLLRWIWRMPVPVEEKEKRVRLVREDRRRAALDPPGRESAGLPIPAGPPVPRSNDVVTEN